MAIVAGTPTHRATVDVYDGVYVEKDQLVRYEGPDDWKFEPLNPVAAVRWQDTVAQPNRALQYNLASRRVLRPPMSEAEKIEAENVRRRESVPVKLGED